MTDLLQLNEDETLDYRLTFTWNKQWTGNLLKMDTHSKNKSGKGL